MHYRWNFPEENLGFLRYHFLYSQRELPDRAEKTDRMMDRMRHAGVAFGATPEAIRITSYNVCYTKLLRMPKNDWDPCE